MMLWSREYQKSLVDSAICWANSNPRKKALKKKNQIKEVVPKMQFFVLKFEPQLPLILMITAKHSKGKSLT